MDSKPARKKRYLAWNMSTKADIIFYGGSIITMDEDAPKGSGKRDTDVEAIALAGGLILAVGNIKTVFNYVGPNTQVIFLNKQTLMPGFIECHQHACVVAHKNSTYTDISSVHYRSYSEIKDVMTKTMNEVEPGNWGLFFGWDPELVPDLPPLSATYLDTNYTSTVPMVVIGQSGHVAWVNSPALIIAEIDKNTDSPPGGTIAKDGNGEPTGQLFEEPAIMMVMSKAPESEREEITNAFVEQWRYYASVGLTTVTELIYMPNEGTDAILRYLADRDDCPIRVGLYKLEHATENNDQSLVLTQKRPKAEYCPNASGADSCTEKTITASSSAKSVGNYSDRLWEAGIKLIGDGSPHCGTAAVREPYLCTPLTETLGFPKAPGYGYLNMTSSALENTLAKFHKQDTQVAIHCHGERAVEQALKAYEHVIGEFGTRDNRHRMEHLGLMTVEQISRAGKLNLALSFFVDHLRFYGLVYKTDIFGDRVNRWTPLSEATKSGVKWSIHQDHPTFPGNACPFSNMKTAVTRCTRDDPNTPYGPEYRVSIHEALKAYTSNAAWQLHREKDLGSITVGKKADLVVLSRNPYDVDPFELESIRVIDTYLEGRSNKFATVVTIPSTNINILEPIN